MAALNTLPGVVRADDGAGDSAAVVQDKTVVVTATRTVRTVDESQAAVQVVGRAEIERSQANDVGELLRVLAGIDVARNGGPVQAASVFIRGAESNQTLVMIRGVKVNDATVGAGLPGREYRRNKRPFSPSPAAGDHE